MPPTVPEIIAVHPHACGERVGLAPLFFSRLGSSPRMWGTHNEELKEYADTRFIPTHVGNAGGNEINPVITRGSSPRMWGTHYLPLNGSGRERFIPTHVGNARQP